MKKIEELTKGECQIFLNENFDKNVDFNDIKFDCDNIDGCGIEYKVKNHDFRGLIPFSNPDLIMWLYKNDYDITTPLTQLRIDYMELEETNSTLFEYAMEVSDVASLDVHNILGRDRELEKIKNLRKELVKRLC